ncbi:hypothetical protein NP233_g9047 [Leucocoprinus birnbaumii]|uniref:DUF6534 domain-containing protein n=1 Tax=Leucocoprinus birnbaumii TaxID=56174 RepID=A0AAD5VNL4_9AGAR|nr:hypothetical protein NP233_g9047 [Leucocoprinus birnbaumii]
MKTMLIVGVIIPSKLEADFLIAALLCYYVLKRSEGTRHMRVTSTLVNQIIRYTVATSALTRRSVIIIASLITFVIAPYTFFYMALQFSSGRTYANAVLVSLNARRKFRKTIEDIEPSFAKSSQLAEISNAIRRLPRLTTISTQDYSSGVSSFPSQATSREKEPQPFSQVPSSSNRRSRSNSVP